MAPSISSGASQRAEPAAVSVADADLSVTSSITLLIPKSQMQASPLIVMSDRISTSLLGRVHVLSRIRGCSS
jgi:hypothetical protein